MSSLEEYIRTRLQDRRILLMTHLVLGYPSFEVNRQVIRQMVENGVDLIELQIPFSEPVADGPMILKANQEAIAQGAKVEQCLHFAGEITAEFHIPFLFMTYYNILFKYGMEGFIERCSNMNIKGFIIPDLPPEEGRDYLDLARKSEMAPIQIFAPTSTRERMQLLAQNGAGFIYCVARRGVTGKKTDFSKDFSNYISAIVFSSFVRRDWSSAGDSRTSRPGGAATISDAAAAPRTCRLQWDSASVPRRMSIS